MVCSSVSVRQPCLPKMKAAFSSIIWHSSSHFSSSSCRSESDWTPGKTGGWKYEPGRIGKTSRVWWEHERRPGFTRWPVTLCGCFVEAGEGDIGCVMAVTLIRLCEAVHVQQLPVGHLPVCVKHFLAFQNRPYTNHLQTVLRREKKIEDDWKALTLNC